MQKIRISYGHRNSIAFYFIFRMRIKSMLGYGRKGDGGIGNGIWNVGEVDEVR